MCIEEEKQISNLRSLNTQEAKENKAGTNMKIEAENCHKEKKYVRIDLHMKVQIESAPYTEKTAFW